MLSNYSRSSAVLVFALSMSRRVMSYKPIASIDKLLKRIEISPPADQAVKGSVIFLHGLGDTAYGWADTTFYIAQQIPGLRFVLLTAPSQPVTLNGGYVMPSWYDIKGLDERSNETCDGIIESQETVLDVLQKEVERGIAPEKIVIGGFSQGGAMSLWTGLQIADKNIAGVLCLSGYLPNAANWKLSACGTRTPVAIFHGEDDQVVKLSMAEKSCEFVKKGGATQMLYKTYADLTHSVCDEEIGDVISWLKNIFK